MHAFSQVDVFSVDPLRGNPVAVVHGADDLTDEQLAAFARWTNLSETTFLLTPTTDDADYRLRIFTPGGELPFAGHPTLGSAHAWLEAGGKPKMSGTLIQECGAGLVPVRAGERLAFEAPPLMRAGDVDPDTIAQIAAGLRIGVDDILASQWVDNGPGWVAVQLADAQAVLGLQPDFVAMGGLKIGAVGTYPEGSDCAIEVRAFCPDLAVPEDPVTGSLNAGVAQWLIGSGVLPSSYVASQGAALQRRGRVTVEQAPDGGIWIGGATSTTIRGELAL